MIRGLLGGLWRRRLRPNSRRRGPQTRFKPNVEGLELRIVPAFYNWIGDVSNDWADGDNWAVGTTNNEETWEQNPADPPGPDDIVYLYWSTNPQHASQHAPKISKTQHIEITAIATWFGFGDRTLTIEGDPAQQQFGSLKVTGDDYPYNSVWSEGRIAGDGILDIAGRMDVTTTYNSAPVWTDIQVYVSGKLYFKSDTSNTITYDVDHLYVGKQPTGTYTAAYAYFEMTGGVLNFGDSKITAYRNSEVHFKMDQVRLHPSLGTVDAGQFGSLDLQGAKMIVDNDGDSVTVSGTIRTGSLVHNGLTYQSKIVLQGSDLIMDHVNPTALTVPQRQQMIVLRQQTAIEPSGGTDVSLQFADEAAGLYMEDDSKIVLPNQTGFTFHITTQSLGAVIMRENSRLDLSANSGLVLEITNLEMRDTSRLLIKANVSGNSLSSYSYVNVTGTALMHDSIGNVGGIVNVTFTGSMTGNAFDASMDIVRAGTYSAIAGGDGELSDPGGVMFGAAPGFGVTFDSDLSDADKIQIVDNKLRLNLTISPDGGPGEV